MAERTAREIREQNRRRAQERFGRRQEENRRLGYAVIAGGAVLFALVFAFGLAVGIALPW